MEARRYRAGQQIEDLCRACKADRMHTIIVVDSAGAPLRVSCGFCGSEHNYRGGGRTPASSPSVSSGWASWDPGPGSGSAAPMPRNPSVESPSKTERPAGAIAARPTPASATADAAPFPLISDRERTLPPMSLDSSTGSVDLELLLRRVIREESGLTMVTPAAKWRNGQLVLKPGNAELQEKIWPIETFFHKIVMLRNRLRTLEQQVNATDLPEDAKVKLQSYITGCYGSLTSFNILFAEEDDKFRGTGE